MKKNETNKVLKWFWSFKWIVIQTKFFLNKIYLTRVQLISWLFFNNSNQIDPLTRDVIYHLTCTLQNINLCSNRIAKLESDFNARFFFRMDWMLMQLGLFFSSLLNVDVRVEGSICPTSGALSVTTIWEHLNFFAFSLRLVRLFFSIGLWFADCLLFSHIGKLKF